MADTVRQYKRFIALLRSVTSLTYRRLEKNRYRNLTPRSPYPLLYNIHSNRGKRVTYEGQTKLPLMNLSRICLVALLLHTQELKTFIGSDQYVKMIEQVENCQTIPILR